LQQVNPIGIRYKIWLESGDKCGILGDGKWKLLKTIDETGSVKAAMEVLGLTYRKTWDSLNKIERLFGFPVVHRQRGGIDGGKTELTPQGQAIVSAFDHFHAKYDSMINNALQETLNEIVQKVHE